MPGPRVSAAVLIRLGILLALVVGVIIAQWQWQVFDVVSAQSLGELLDRAGAWAPLLYMLSMAVAIVISPIPSVPLAVAAGLFFGPLLGTIYSLGGALAGALAAFCIGRQLGRKVIERILGKPLQFYPTGTDKLIARVVFLSRLIPVVSFDIVSYGAGLTSLSILRFAGATLVGMIPLTLVYCYFGAVILVDGWIALSIGILFVAIFLLLPRLVRRYNLFYLRRYLFPDQNPEEGRE